ncbi:MAG: FKBP-type peptidyl-prolyl cis-trans isomerase [Myxococcota bacterium]
MLKPITVIGIGSGIALATVAFVGMYLYMESPDESEQISEVGAKSGSAPSARAGDPVPTQIDSGAYEKRERGLMIHDMQVGTGPSPVKGQSVQVHYSGWLQDGGRMFDSSVANKRPPYEFQVGVPGVIEGWQLGVADMKVGGKRQLVIPPGLAYGPSGRPPVIPANSTLVFDVELVGLGDIRVAPTAPTDIDFAADARVQTLDKGVQVIELSPGEGNSALDRSVVDAELSVWNPEGKKFFSSWNQPKGMKWWLGGRGRELPPLEGLKIAVQGMKPGGVRLVQIPAEAAFGEKGQLPVVQPNSPVLAKIEVLSVTEPRIVPEKIVSFNKSAMTTTDSGLMYTDVMVGEGAQPKAGEIVHADYSGWLEDGTLFDSSYKRMAALTFPLGEGNVIKAWDEAIAGMNVGGTRIIVAPADIAYGEAARGQIPANATLIFEITLRKVDPKP